MNGYIIVPCVLVFAILQTDGWTPLHAASQEGHVEVVRALVGAGAAVNQAAVREDLGGCWCSGVRLWLAFGIAACACSFVCVICVCVCGVCMVIERCDAHAALRVLPRPLMLSRTR